MECFRNVFKECSPPSPSSICRELRVCFAPHRPQDPLHGNPIGSHGFGRFYAFFCSAGEELSSTCIVHRGTSGPFCTWGPTFPSALSIAHPCPLSTGVQHLVPVQLVVLVLTSSESSPPFYPDHFQRQRRTHEGGFKSLLTQ